MARWLTKLRNGATAARRVGAGTAHQSATCAFAAQLHINTRMVMNNAVVETQIPQMPSINRTRSIVPSLYITGFVVAVLRVVQPLLCDDEP